MSSMTRVMEKLGDNASPPVEPAVAPQAPPQETPAAAAPPSGEAIGQFVPEPPAADSAFVPGEPEPAASVPVAATPLVVPTNRAVEWNPAAVDPVVVAFHDRYSAVCEQYRSVRARLVTMNPARAHQVIAITSSVPEEGKSVSTLNLGLVMAEGGEHRMLLVDADLRRTSLARMLGIPSKPGLADVLRGETRLEDVIQPSPFPNLFVLPAGEVKDNGYAELFGRVDTGTVVRQCREMFDYTFVDTPPITTVSDVCLLAPLCDGVLMVIEMHRTPEPTVQQAVRTLQANKVKVLGCLLSRFRDHTAGYYEHYYSSYYYRH